MTETERGVTPHSIQDWRSAHAWLRGYSDAQRGVADVKVAGRTYDQAAYLRGAEVAIQEES